MAFPVYPSDLNDEEWALLGPLIPLSKPHGRPRSSDMRRITNGVFYVLRSGCAWRYLPRALPPDSHRLVALPSRDNLGHYARPVLRLAVIADSP